MTAARASVLRHNGRYLRCSQAVAARSFRSSPKRWNIFGSHRCVVLHFWVRGAAVRYCCCDVQQCKRVHKKLCLHRTVWPI